MPVYINKFDKPLGLIHDESSVWFAIPEWKKSGNLAKNNPKYPTKV